jgi:hypothetical protein
MSELKKDAFLQMKEVEDVLWFVRSFRVPLRFAFRGLTLVILMRLPTSSLIFQQGI